MTPFVRTTPKRLVVHLGNMGSHRGEKTRKYAKRFPNIKFIGIDLTPLVRLPGEAKKPRNWKQQQGDFFTRLRRQKPDSVDVISSELAVGYYGRPEQNMESDRSRPAPTTQLLKTIHEKLKPGGKCFLVVDSIIRDRLLEMLANTPFRPEKISFYRIPTQHMDRTNWMRSNQFPVLFQLTLEK